MPDVNTTMYQPLQATQQQQMGPLQVLQLIGQMNQNKLFDQEFQARQNIGQSWQNSVRKDGSIDYPQAQGEIAKTGGFLAGEGLGHATANATADTGLKGVYQQSLHSIFGQLATEKGISDQKISEAMATASARGVPGPLIQDYVSSLPRGDTQKGQAARRDWAVTRSNLARGPEAIAAGGTIQGPTGGMIQRPEGSMARDRAAGGLPVTLPSGVPESFAEGQRSLQEDQKKAAGIQANLRNLEIALPLAEKLNHGNFGPTSPEWAKARATAISMGIISSKADDPQTMREELNKYMLKYAKSSNEAGRSDQALATAIGSSPNLDLTQAANLGLMKNQIGLDKMDAALPTIFKKEHPNPEDAAGYNAYKSGEYYNKFDRQAFSYHTLTPEERRSLVQNLGPKNSPAYKKFNNTYELAKKAGIIVPEKQ